MSASATYTTRPQLEDLFERQLDALLVQLRSAIKLGTPYRTSQERSCPYCRCCLFMYYHDKRYCLKCDDISMFGNDACKKIAKIIQSHPDIQKSIVCLQKQEKNDEEFKPIVTHTPQVSKIQYGMMVQEARKKNGMARSELAGKIKHSDSTPANWRMIERIERGESYPRLSIRKQIAAILSIDAQVSIEDERAITRKDDKVTYGRYIRQERESRGWTRTILVQKLKWDDGRPVSYSVIQKIENGENYPGTWLKYQLEQALS
jgi:Predicted transcription factor, homolog of eukaryotic MBF1